MADIFISYSKQDPEPTRDLAAYLKSQGYSVWWDTGLTSGEIFRDVIDRELDAADAVIVIWTTHSVVSDWVLSEAEHARRDEKLITLRTRDLALSRIPKPFGVRHTDVTDDRAAILAAVRRVAGPPDYRAATNTEFRRFDRAARKGRHRPPLLAIYKHWQLSRLWTFAVSSALAIGTFIGAIVRVIAAQWRLIGLLLPLSVIWVNEAGHEEDRSRESMIIRNTSPPVPQKVGLYEEEQTNPNAPLFAGSAVWRTEWMAPGPDQKPDVIVRADIEIPEGKISLRWTLRRNIDKQLPASHTVEFVFTLPPDFPHGGISNIPGVLMKQGETTRGIPLNGVAVKVTGYFFLIGLSPVEADLQRNVQLLKERSWFDIPVVYSDGKRVIIAVEKGTSGGRAFTEAFAIWDSLTYRHRD